MKKIIKIGLIILSALFILAAGYVASVFLSYHRIEDNLQLPVRTPKEAASEVLKLNREYSALAYNIGFGAYLPDYSFFMDGGKYSWAKSKESVIYSTNGVAEIIQSYSPDFSLFQEMDIDGTRSRHVNQKEMLDQALPKQYSIFAMNYDSAFLMYPLHQPHGKNKSGIALYSNYPITSSLRRSLPISTEFSRFFDLDRCYSISRLPVENNKELIIFNVHLTAYTDDERIREGQLQMLIQDMETEYQKGNYVLCGGDFNYNIKNKVSEKAKDMTWAQPFPKEKLPEHFRFAIDTLSDEDQEAMWDSNRNADKPYTEGESLTVTIDGFIYSDNMETTFYENIKTGFKYSDHEPVLMKFKLLP